MMTTTNQSDKTVREWHREAGNVPNYAQLQDAVLHIPAWELADGEASLSNGNVDLHNVRPEWLKELREAVKLAKEIAFALPVYSQAQLITSAPDLIMCLGLEVKNWRETRDITFCQLAKRARISKATLSKIEHGKHNPTIKTVVKLCNALRIGFNDLVNDPREGD